MTLSKAAIEAIDTKEMRRDLMMLLDKTENSIRNYINDNSPNGELTKTSVIDLISRKTGLSKSKILINETQPA